VVVKVGVIKILQKEFDLCEEACVLSSYSECPADRISSRKAHASISCPVEKGEHTVEHTVELPKEIPKGICYPKMTTFKPNVSSVQLLSKSTYAATPSKMSL
jgi:hypothetical protein